MARGRPPKKVVEAQELRVRREMLRTRGVLAGVVLQASFLIGKLGIVLHHIL